MRIEPTQELLKTLLHYDKETGVFVWKKRSRDLFNTPGSYSTWNTRFSCKTAGGLCKFTGYVFIGINGIQYRAHRLAWLYVHGYIPEFEIDHKDTIRHHNWIDNLREATKSENMKNRPKQKNNTSGYKGVCFDKSVNKWKAQIRSDYKLYDLGHYNNPEHAYIAYCEASKQLHKEFSRVSK